MSASRNQVDLPGRELMCVNDASVCRCMTQITIIWALTLVYRAAFLPYYYIFRAYFIVFQLKNAQYVSRAAVLLCYTGGLRIRDVILLCEYLDFSHEDF